MRKKAMATITLHADKHLCPMLPVNGVGQPLFLASFE